MNSLFKALNDETRRQIIELLKEKDMNAGEIANRFNISKPSISHHLDILKRADLITSEKKGQFVEYSLNTSILEDLLNWILTLKKSIMSLKKELPLIAIVLLPFIYLAYLWNDLPNKVPMHWNIKGEIDRYGDKSELIIIPILLPLLVYLIFLVVPKIDPKNKLNTMGSKLQTIKFLLTTFMSILALFIIYTAKNQTFTNPNYIVLLIGLLYLILGNYFKTIKANYFIGIRTPWTLENETVWKETHRLGGKMWFIGGLIIIISSLMLEKQTNFTLFIVISAIITVIPIIYSYLKFQNLKKQTK